MTEILTGDPISWRLTTPGSTAIAIGVFDGVHRGHVAVLSSLVEEARRRHLAPAILTFDPHPLEVVSPDRAPRLLSTIGQRIETVTAIGFEIVGVLPFETIRQMPPDMFAEEILGGRLAAGLVAVGEDFRFGLDRTGDVDTLRKAGVRHGYDVRIVELLDEDAVPISSSRIRTLIEEGDVDAAAGLLGHSYLLRGVVVEGDQRGRTIGFPTANLAVDPRVALPRNGVYAAWASVGGLKHRSVVNIGIRPTFGGRKRTVEAHLLGGSHELYGHQMDLGFVTRIRDEQKFDGVEALVAQIGKDVTKAGVILDRSSGATELFEMGETDGPDG